MSDAWITYSGFDTMNKVLSSLSIEMATKVGQSAITTAGKSILEEAQNLVPEGKTGKLADSLAIKKLRLDHPAARIYARRFKGFGGWHANLIEFGTKPHDIKNVLIGDKFYPVIHHPGQAAKPFMRPALINKKDYAISEVGRIIFKHAKRKLTVWDTRVSPIPQI